MILKVSYTVLLFKRGWTEIWFLSLTFFHGWAQLTKKLASLTAIPIFKNLASLTLIRYFALFISLANASPLFR